MAITTLTSINYQYTSGYIDIGNPRVDSTKQISDVSNTPLNVTGDRQDALFKLDRLLTQAYDTLSIGTKNPIERYQENTPLTAEKVAHNILGFIERRLQLDQAEGATAEQLQSRLDAGLAGFKKGFAEAEEQLKALSFFSPAIEADLATTNKLVLTGIDELQHKLTQGENLGVPVNASPLSKLNMNHLPVGVSLAAQLTQAFKFDDIDYSKAEARDFQFELTTKEGDKVRIHASASYGASVSRQGNSFESSYSESQDFSFTLEGDLNSDELNSINHLLGKVNALAEQFYAGDVEGAFINAQSLEIEDQQINGFSLNLSQSKIEVVQLVDVIPSEQLVDNSETLPNIVHKEHNYLDDFVEKLLSALDDARRFNHPEKLLLDIAKGIQSLKVSEPESSAQIEHPKNFDDFLARLIRQ